MSLPPSTLSQSPSVDSGEQRISDIDLESGKTDKIEGEKGPEPTKLGHTKDPFLATYDETHEWLKDNEYIRTGYRTNYNVKESWKSLFRIHNETLNVWSHVLGIIIFGIQIGLLVSGYHDSHIGPTNKWIYTAAAFAAIICFASSATYHLFKSTGAEQYYHLLKLDYTGIMINVMAFFLLGVYYGFYNYTFWQRFFVIFFAIQFSILIVLTVWDPPFFDKVRKPVYVSSVASTILPFIVWLVEEAPFNQFNGELIAMLIAMFIFYGVGFWFWHSKFPECKSPGHFDILFASHQLWHLCILIGSIIFLESMIWWHKQIVLGNVNTTG
eukprot:Clim_evm26s9 gene=Clim_evmTU26s9